MIKLPEKYKKRMEKLLGDEFPLYEKALSEVPQKGYRINTEKVSEENKEKLLIFGKEKIPYVENGYYLDFEKAGNHPYHHAGMIYIQEPGAMAPAQCVDIDPQWKILDMCAAPGGKSTQLKNKLSEKGVLVSNEIISSRCKILTGNIERLGLKNTVTTCLDTKRLTTAFPEVFDLIMVDAPCSGEGMFRKEEIAVSEWSEDNVLMCRKRQAEILDNAVLCLKGTGYIIYATCTFSLEENEMTVNDFLLRHPEFKLVPVKDTVKEYTADGIRFEGCECENINECRRFYPHKARGEGQFMAVLYREEESFGKIKTQTLKPQKVDKEIYDFLDSTLVFYEKEKVRIYNSNPVYFTPDFEVPEKTAFACGVTIGELKKNYILPHHQFFMALGDSFKRRLELSVDDERLYKYLHGEEIEADLPDGWAVLCVDGASVGGIKVSKGRAKNHYPKGLRLK